MSTAASSISAPAVNAQNIPADLKGFPNWVVWKYTFKNGEPDKPPFNAKTHSHAKSNDPATWVSFDDAFRVADPVFGSDYDGIGFNVKGSPFVGLDFDGVIQDGKPEPFVLEILKHLGNPYAQITPSGTGLRAFVRTARLPEGGRKFGGKNVTGRKYGAEIYIGSEKGRYLTVTGNKLCGHGIPAIDDISLAYFMVSQILNEKLKTLWMGDFSSYPSQSEADLALLSMILRKVDGDTEKAVAYFGASKLGERPKWSRPDYRQDTLKKAISGKKQPASDDSDADISSEIESSLVTINLTEVQAKPIEWLWKGRIPKGKLVLFSGEPSCGKTTVACDFIAHYTTGRDFFDSPNTATPGRVLLLSAEDSLDDTLKPRLEAAQADLTRVDAVQRVVVSRHAKTTERLLALDTDLAAVEKKLRDNPDIGLVVIDPMQAYVGDKDTNRDKDLRKVLTPITKLCDELGVTFICLGHFNKRSDVNALAKVGGGVAQTAAARVVMLFQEDPGVKDQFRMSIGKVNIAKRSKALKFRIKVVELSVGETPAIQWIGECDESADSVLETLRNPRQKATVKAEELLKSLTEPTLSDEIFEQAKKLGIYRDAVYQARKTLNLQCEQRPKGSGKWWWLPVQPPLEAEPVLSSESTDLPF